MYAVINTKTSDIIRTCKTKEAALIAAELERDKAAMVDRPAITAVVMDDGGFENIMF